MTVITQESFVTYTGNDATTLFPFGFMIQTGADVVTVWSDATGSVQLSPGSYSITGLDNPAGGSITYPLVGSPLDTLHTITIQRILAPVQMVDISGQANFYTQVIEDSLDYLTYLYQQLNFASDRAVLLPIGFPGTGEELLDDIFQAENDATDAAAAASASAAAAAASAASVPPASSANPTMDGAAGPGVAVTYSRGDHVHPSDTSRVAKAGDTMTGNLGINGAGVALILNKAASGQWAQVLGRTNGGNRWNIDLGDGVAEGGANAGSNFNVVRSNDAGVAIDTPLSINRANGVVNASVGFSERGSLLFDLYGAARRNILRRNGGLEIWQRGAGGSASFAAPALTNTYTADGWYINPGSSLGTVTQVAGIANGSQWAAKVQRNAGQTAVNFGSFSFPLDTDELIALQGQFAVLSFTAKAGANWSPASGILGVQLIVGTAAPTKWRLGFTGATNSIVQNLTLTTTPTRFQLNSPAFIPVNTQQVEIAFTWTPVGTAGADDSFTIDDVQLEVVPTNVTPASAFERLQFQEQLALCQRHYWKTFDYSVAPAQNAGVLGAFTFPQVVAAATAQNGNSISFSVPMRVTPNPLTIYNPSAVNAQVRGVSADWSASTVSANNGRAAWINGTTPAATAAGQLNIVHITGDAGI